MRSAIDSHNHDIKRRKTSSPYLQSLLDQLLSQTDTLLSTTDTQRGPPLNYHRLYKYVEFLCRDKVQAQLTELLYSKLDTFIDLVLQQFADATQNATELEVLNQFDNCCSIVSSKVECLQRLYLYLDRTYLLNHPTKNVIAKQTQYLIMLKLFESLNVAPVVLESYLKILDQYMLTRLDSLKELLLRTYRNLKDIIETSPVIFDELILEHSASFLGNAHDQIIQDASKDSVFDRFFEIIVAELNYWAECNSANDPFLKDVKELVVRRLLFDDFEKECPEIAYPMFVSKKFESLARLYSFIKHSENVDQNVNKNLKTFASVWSKYILDYVSNLIEANSQEIIYKLIQSKKTFNSILQNYFQSDLELDFRFRESFQQSLKLKSKDSSILSKLLKFIDHFFKTLDVEQDNESSIEDILLIFKSVHSKSLFLKQYQRDLSRRLILKTTMSLSLERRLVLDFEKEVGLEDCSNLFRMIDDITENTELLKEYEQNSSYEVTHDIEFKPLVLNSIAWPQPNASIQLQENLGELLSNFQDFYINKFEKHKLKWSPGLSYMTISAHFKHGDKELEVSTFQGAVLLVFNDKEFYTFQEIKDKTLLDSKTLASVLYSLTNGKHKILNKETFDKNRYYSINDEFQDKRKTLKIKQIQMKLKNGESEEGSDELLNNDDQLMRQEKEEFIQASIVRILKHEGEMRHDALIHTVLKDMVVETKDIQKSIKSLIYLEYIESIDTDVYRYIP